MNYNCTTICIYIATYVHNNNYEISTITLRKLCSTEALKSMQTTIHYFIDLHMLATHSSQT